MPRASLLEFITRSWPIKAAALFLSLMLYVAVQLPQPLTATSDVTVHAQLRPGRPLIQNPPKVYAQISGKGTQILKLRSLAGDITRRVPDTLTAPTWVVHLAPSDVELELPKGADVRVIEVRPSEITLALDSVARKDVRIVSLVTLTLAPAQLLQGARSMTPNVGRAVGPGKRLAPVK